MRISDWSSDVCSSDLDEEGDADAAPMLPHLGEGREVDFQQHRDDHQPDEDRDRQVYLRELGRADRVEDRREEMAEGDADNDAEGDPEGQVALEGRQGAYSGRAGGVAASTRSRKRRSGATASGLRE